MPANNASQKQADTTRRRQHFKHTNTKGLLSLCTWGCPFARTARSRTMQGQTTMPHHPRVSPFAVGSSGILQGWPQGACTATHPTNGATQHGQGTAIHTARCATSHDESKQPSSPQGQHTIAPGPSEKAQSLQKCLTHASSQKNTELS